MQMGVYIKYKAKEDVERFNAMLVAKGFSQKDGLNYTDTFSHVSKIMTVRSIIFVVYSQLCHIY